MLNAAAPPAEGRYTWYAGRSATKVAAAEGEGGGGSKSVRSRFERVDVDVDATPAAPPHADPGARALGHHARRASPSDAAAGL